MCPTASFSMLAQFGAKAVPKAGLKYLPALRGHLPSIWHRARPNSEQRGRGLAGRENPGRGSTTLAREGAETCGPSRYIYSSPSHPRISEFSKLLVCPHSSAPTPGCPGGCLLTHPQLWTHPLPSWCGTPAGSPCLQPRGYRNRTELTVLPPPHPPTSHQGSGHAKRFHAFVAALQLVCFQWKHVNNSMVFVSDDFK